MNGGRKVNAPSRLTTFSYRFGCGAAVSFTAVGIAAVGLVAGFTNAIEGSHREEIATFEHILERANTYCSLSLEEVEELLSRFLSPSNDALDELLYNYVMYFSETTPSVLDVYSKLLDDGLKYRNTAFGLPIDNTGNLRVLERAAPIVEYSRPNRPRPELWDGEASDYPGGTLEMDAAFLVLDVVNKIENAAIKNHARTKSFIKFAPDTMQPRLFQDFLDSDTSTAAIEDFTRLSLSGNCQWRFSEIPKSSLYDLIRQLFLAMLDDSPAPHIYQHLDNWHGGYALSFTNPSFRPEGADGEKLAGVAVTYSIVMPFRTALEFIQNVSRVAMLVWFAMVVAVVAATLWITSKPLRKLDIATLDAGSIIRSDRKVSAELGALAKQLHGEKSPVRELQILLSELSFLLEERELWMGKLVHQIKNDLTAMIMGLGNIERNIPDSDPSFRHINNAAHRIRNALRSVATYQWIILGKNQQLEPSVVIDLGSLLETIATEIEDVGGYIRSAVAEKLYVVGHPESIRIALQNLVWNAHLHGGAIEIEAYKDESGQYAEIIIDDNGPGIVDDDIEELHRPYKRGKNHSANIGSAYGNAGLGLSIVRHVIASHDGCEILTNRRSKSGEVIGLRAFVKLPLHIIS